jgi:hypothetical protein
MIRAPADEPIALLSLEAVAGVTVGPDSDASRRERSRVREASEHYTTE